jgi:hypothetical protein
MAIWGRDGAPNLSAFTSAAKLFQPESEYVNNPNWYQCLALTEAVLGKRQEMLATVETARRIIRAYDRREFSCWTYLDVSPGEFEDHLDAIVQFGSEDGPIPAVFRQFQTGGQ